MQTYFRCVDGLVYICEVHNKCHHAQKFSFQRTLRLHEICDDEGRRVMDMTMMEFQLLAVADQVNILYKKGVYIGKRKQAHLTRLLFQVDTFYVEVAYSMYRRYIAAIKCSRSTALLDPYLEQIDVEHWVG